MHGGLDDGEALCWLEEGHHAEVEVRELALRVDEEVAHVRVRMKEAVAQHLAQRALHERVDDVRGLVDVARLVGRVACEGGETRAVDPLHGEHLVRVRVRTRVRVRVRVDPLHGEHLGGREMG